MCHTQYSYFNISALYRSDNTTVSAAPNLHAMARGAPKFRYFRDILALCTGRKTRDLAVAVSLVTRVHGSADTCLLCAVLWPALLWQPFCTLYSGKAVQQTENAVNPGQVAKYKNGIRKQKVKSFRKVKTGITKHRNVGYPLRQTAIKSIKVIRLYQ